MTNRQITWRKFVDPLGSDLDEIEWPGYNDILEPEDALLDDFDFLSDEEGKPIPNPYKLHRIIPHKIINTPMGLLSITEHTLLTTTTDLWVMQTNFNITEEIAIIISNIDGVEILDVITRYRAIVGIPKSGLFDSSEVKLNIEKILKTSSSIKDNNEALMSLLEKLFGSDVVEKIEKEKEKISEGIWAIFVFPNGSIETIVDGEGFSKKIKELDEINQMIGGFLITSDL